jgi:hypothetical protein
MVEDSGHGSARMAMAIVMRSSASDSECARRRNLPYVHAEGEEEVREAFARVFPLRTTGPDVAAVADRWFFETVVRVHRAGEHAAYTGLKPADLRTRLNNRLERVVWLAAGKDTSVTSLPGVPHHEAHRGQRGHRAAAPEGSDVR